jgi:hypothetical protein
VDGSNRRLREWRRVTLLSRQSPIAIPARVQRLVRRHPGSVGRHSICRQTFTRTIVNLADNAEKSDNKKDRSFAIMPDARSGALRHFRKITEVCAASNVTDSATVPRWRPKPTLVSVRIRPHARRGEFVRERTESLRAVLVRDERTPSAMSRTSFLISRETSCFLLRMERHLRIVPNECGTVSAARFWGQGAVPPTMAYLRVT